MPLRRCAALLLALAASGADAQQQTFDFESAPPGFVPSLTFIGAGVTLTVTRGGSLPIQVYDHNPPALPAGWGRRAIGAPVSGITPDPFILNFSTPLQAVSLQAGDFGGDGDFMTLRAYSAASGGGTLLDTQTFNYTPPMSLPDLWATLAVAAPSGQGIASVILTSADSTKGNFSIVFDNVVATAIPSPGALPLLLALPLAASRRSRS